MKSIVYSYVIIFFLLTSCNNNGNSFLSGKRATSLNTPLKTFNSPMGFTSVALTENGEIWQWNLGNKLEQPKIQKINIRNVCSIDHAMSGISFLGIALQSNGRIKEWDVMNPEQIKDHKTEKPVKKVSCSSTHGLFLYKDGTIGGEGYEDAYIGLKSLNNVIDIAAGDGYSIACTQDGKVYITGQNNFVAFQNKESMIKGAYQMTGLENIIKVGTNDMQNHYAVDKLGFMYYWDRNTHIKRINFLKTPEKAKSIYQSYYLNNELKLKWRPDYKKGAGSIYLDYEKDKNFINAIEVEQFNNFSLVLNNDGSVEICEIEDFPAGQFIGSKVISKIKISDLKVDLSYYKL